MIRPRGLPFWWFTVNDLLSIVPEDGSYVCYVARYTLSVLQANPLVSVGSGISETRRGLATKTLNLNGQHHMHRTTFRNWANGPIINIETFKPTWHFCLFSYHLSWWWPCDLVWAGEARGLCDYWCVTTRRWHLVHCVGHDTPVANCHLVQQWRSGPAHLPGMVATLQ